MDPASAIGVAAAVLQFIDVGLKFIDTCKKIRVGGQWSEQLDDDSKALEYFRKELGATPNTTGLGKDVIQVALECQEIAKELKDLIEWVRGPNGYRGFGAVKALMGSGQRRKKIQELRTGLRNREDGLSTTILRDLHINAKELRDEMKRRDISVGDSIDQISHRLGILHLETQQRIAE
jgi:hypothetical protein